MMILLMLVSFVVALNGILLMICADLESIISYDTRQFLYINCDFGV